MDFYYNVWYVDEWCIAHKTYSGDDRTAALKQYKRERRNQGYTESVYLLVRSPSAIMKAKAGNMLSYYRHSECFGGECEKRINRW